MHDDQLFVDQGTARHRRIDLAWRIFRSLAHSEYAMARLGFAHASGKASFDHRPRLGSVPDDSSDVGDLGVWFSPESVGRLVRITLAVGQARCCLPLVRIARDTGRHTQADDRRRQLAAVSTSALGNFVSDSGGCQHCLPGYRQTFYLTNPGADLYTEN